MSKSNQRGFTMIELVVVIVILGILAAFALPRYMGLENQARVAALNGMEGSIRSAANMAHGVWLANGNVSPITVDGKTVTIVKNPIYERPWFIVAVGVGAIAPTPTATMNHGRS